MPGTLDVLYAAVALVLIAGILGFAVWLGARNARAVVRDEFFGEHVVDHGSHPRGGEL